MGDRTFTSGTDEPTSGSTGGDLVDLTLVDATLAMTVEERLRQNDQMIRTALALASQTGCASWLLDG